MIYATSKKNPNLLENTEMKQKKYLFNLKDKTFFKWWLCTQVVFKVNRCINRALMIDESSRTKTTSVIVEWVFVVRSC